MFLFSCYGGNLDLHVLTHSFPTRRSSDLLRERMSSSDLMESILEFARSNGGARAGAASARSEEHTSELQSLMRISYAAFCLKKTKTTSTHTTPAAILVHDYTPPDTYRQV